MHDSWLVYSGIEVASVVVLRLRRSRPRSRSRGADAGSPRPIHGGDQPALLVRSGTRSNANALSKLHGMLLTASAVEADGPFRSRADNAIAADDLVVRS
jgi:hypothetical protein